MKRLILGFVLSIILTLAAYCAVVCHGVHGKSLLFLVLGLGGVQALIQMICFLDLGMESKPYWQLITFVFMAVILGVVVGGSLWIMYHLNYNMMI
ncbi:MAG: cytochrome C oxidase subunit IV family protein [Simkaniaceae bacterium]|nr:cytochrome C oxidase subunit IV family protein [Simkaniaceae bacterium]